jgi:acyl-CoA reductase-like NAD-dependent aldehyde dehydrogenase
MHEPLPAHRRAEILEGVARLLAERHDELARTISAEAGKPLKAARVEAERAVSTFTHAAAEARGLAGDVVPMDASPVGAGKLAFTLRMPIGVVGAISPFNFPLNLVAHKVAPALAAGCAVVLKPDPSTPLTALRLGELAAEVGIPPGVVNIVPGDGPTTGAYLVRHPGVDKVAFTGSTATGSEIMRLCSQPLKRVSLELGGKSPNLVFADANLEDAVPSSVYAIYYAAGQSCDARSRVLVEKPLYDDFVSRFTETAAKMRTGDPLDPETQMGSLISQSHREKVHGLVERGREEGAEVVTGGEPADGDGAFYPPTVLAGVENRMAVAQEEIFGPVVTVIPFEDEAEAVRIANDVQYGLTATVWTADPGRGHRLARQIKSGVIGINLPNTAFPGMPFGGYKQSGFGREGSLETIEMYLETKAVYTATGAKPVNPWSL